MWIKSLTVLLVLSGVLFSIAMGLFGYAYIFYTDYDREKQHLTKEIAGYKRLHAASCLTLGDDITTAEYQACHTWKEAMERDISSEALYEILMRRGWCMGMSCTAIFSSNPATILYIVSGAIVIILSSGAFGITMNLRQLLTSPYLPSKKDL